MFVLFVCQVHRFEPRTPNRDGVFSKPVFLIEPSAAARLLCLHSSLPLGDRRGTGVVVGICRIFGQGWIVKLVFEPESEVVRER